MKTIALDIRFRAMSGASIALQNLARHLVRQTPSGVRFLAVRYADQALPAELEALDAIMVPKMRAPVELIWNELRLPGLLKHAGVDLYHAMKQCAPMRLPCPSVHTVDAIKRGRSDDLPMPLFDKLYWGWHACSMYKKSAHLLPVSGYVGDFLIADLKIDPAKVTVVYNGVNDQFLNTDRTAKREEPKPIELDVPYVICVGSVIPLKNQVAAVKALARIADRVPHHLALLGNEDRVYGRLVRQAAEDGGIADRVHMVGFVNMKSLLLHMCHAQAMMHVSRTEGYCLATGEAMACGLPLVLTDRGGLREQCGEAALYIDDPDDHAALAGVLLKVLTDAQLRRTMRERGLALAESLSWPEAARRTLGVYSRVLALGPVGHSPDRSYPQASNSPTV
ncbi:MAG: glycosyltransferase family 4 protein [Phycisphaerales bacterium]